MSVHQNSQKSQKGKKDKKNKKGPEIDTFTQKTYEQPHWVKIDGVDAVLYPNNRKGIEPCSWQVCRLKDCPRYIEGVFHIGGAGTEQSQQLPEGHKDRDMTDEPCIWEYHPNHGFHKDSSKPLKDCILESARIVDGILGLTYDAMRLQQQGCPLLAWCNSESCPLEGNHLLGAGSEGLRNMGRGLVAKGFYGQELLKSPDMNPNHISFRVTGRRVTCSFEIRYGHFLQKGLREGTLQRDLIPTTVPVPEQAPTAVSPWDTTPPPVAPPCATTPSPPPPYGAETSVQHYPPLPGSVHAPPMIHGSWADAESGAHADEGSFASTQSQTPSALALAFGFGAPVAKPTHLPTPEPVTHVAPAAAVVPAVQPSDVRTPDTDTQIEQVMQLFECNDVTAKALLKNRTALSIRVRRLFDMSPEAADEFIQSEF